MSTEPLHRVLDPAATAAPGSRPSSLLRQPFLPGTTAQATTPRTDEPPTLPVYTAVTGAIREGTLYAQSVLAADLRARRIESRAEDIEALGAPRSLEDFFSRAADTLADLREMAAAFPTRITAEHRARLDDIDQAMKLLKGATEKGSGGGSGGAGSSGGGGGGGGAGGGGGGDGPPPIPFGRSPDREDDDGKSWFARMAGALTAMGSAIAGVARDMADALAAPVKSAWGAVKLAVTAFTAGAIGHPLREVVAHSKLARAWAGCWYLGGKVTVGVLIGWLPGLI